jgi:hypothetical protein
LRRELIRQARAIATNSSGDPMMMMAQTELAPAQEQNVIHLVVVCLFVY